MTSRQKLAWPRNVVLLRKGIELPIDSFGWIENKEPWLSPVELERDRQEIGAYAEEMADAAQAAAEAASAPGGGGTICLFTETAPSGVTYVLTAGVAGKGVGSGTEAEAGTAGHAYNTLIK